MYEKNKHGGDIYRHPDVIDFSVNMNPAGPPSEVIRAVRESAERIAQYPDTEKEKIASLLAEKEQVPRQWLIFGNGAAELIFLWAQALHPAKAVIAAPSFREYTRALEAVGCRTVSHRLRREEDFRLTDRIFDDLTEDTDALILCDPNNPTGRLIEPGLMRAVIAHCRQYGIRLLVDECFLDLCDDKEVYSVKQYLASEPLIFLLNAFTKTYAMAGLRLGWGASSDLSLLKRMRELSQPWNVSVPAQAAGEAALQTEEAYLKRSVEIIREERRYLTESGRDLGWEVCDSDANFILFHAQENLGRELLKRGFMIRDCRNFDGLGAGDFRIAVRPHEDNRKLISAARDILQEG